MWSLSPKTRPGSARAGGPGSSAAYKAAVAAAASQLKHPNSFPRESGTGSGRIAVAIMEAKALLLATAMIFRISTIFLDLNEWTAKMKYINNMQTQPNSDGSLHLYLYSGSINIF